MRRRRIVASGGQPRVQVARKLEGPFSSRPGDVELVRGPDEARVAQPQYAVLAVIEFRSVMVMGGDGMQGRMPVHERLRVVGVRLVEMLLRHGGGNDKPGRQGKSDDRAAEPG